jgi:cell shape-determining protein MreC
VGVVSSVEQEQGSNYLDIIIELTEDMTRTGFVYVVRDLQLAERDTLEQAHDSP